MSAKHILHRHLGAALGLTLALMLGACQPWSIPAPSSQPAGDADGPPLTPHGDLSQLPDPVPRAEAKSSRGNPVTYEVFGKRYRVMESAQGYAEDGNASWYGRKFHGRTTSSGEPFDMFTLTAAHRSLPIPTYVRVTRRDTGAQVIVRVNDRGPFHSNRIIDLSYAAAVKLGFHEQGTAPVRVEVIKGSEPITPQTAAQPTAAPANAAVIANATPRPAELVYLQAGAFGSLQAADQLAKDLSSALAGYSSSPNTQAYVVQMGADALYRVRIGPVAGQAAAERLKGHLVDANFAPPVILP